MSDSDPRKASEMLQEIHRQMSFGRKEDDRSGAKIAAIWGVLCIASLAVCTAMAYQGVQGSLPYTGAWAVVNAIGWILTFRIHGAAVRAGRRSLRGDMVLKTWAMVTLSIWLSVWLYYGPGLISPMAIHPLVSLLLGLGIFVTGLLHESAPTRWIGVSYAILGVVVPPLFPAERSFLASLILMAAAMTSWPVASRLLSRREG